LLTGNVKVGFAIGVFFAPQGLQHIFRSADFQNIVLPIMVIICEICWLTVIILRNIRVEASKMDNNGGVLPFMGHDLLPNGLQNLVV
jgi:hypothetical protein